MSKLNITTKSLKKTIQELFIEHGSEELAYKLPMLMKLQKKVIGVLDAFEIELRQTLNEQDPGDDILETETKIWIKGSKDRKTHCYIDVNEILGENP